MTIELLNKNVPVETKLPEEESMNQLSSFMRRYRMLLSNRNHQRLQEFNYSFSGIRAGLRSLEKICATHDQYVAPDFNFFRVMGIHSRENKTHSSLIANLLDPNGSHGQGGLFLEAFLSTCIASGKLKKQFIKISVSGWEVFRELSMEDGRMDLVLRHLKADALLVIENKIYAADQDRQLERYWDWMQISRKTDDSLQSLLYLTLNGSSPTKEPCAGVIYEKISYKKEINDWLLKVIPEVKAPMVSTVIKQYSELIPTL